MNRAKNKQTRRTSNQLPGGLFLNRAKNKHNEDKVDYQFVQTSQRQIWFKVKPGQTNAELRYITWRDTMMTTPRHPFRPHTIFSEIELNHINLPVCKTLEENRRTIVCDRCRFDLGVRREALPRIAGGPRNIATINRADYVRFYLEAVLFYDHGSSFVYSLDVSVVHHVTVLRWGYIFGTNVDGVTTLLSVGHRPTEGTRTIPVRAEVVDEEEGGGTRLRVI